MDIEVLKSYLVSLGFDINQKQLNDFDSALKNAAGMVDANVGGMLKSVLKAQAGIASTFAGIAGGVVAMADHVAMADQKYRLLGMRMFMTTEAARALQKGLDVLGASLEDVAWDPELRSHFIELQEDQKRWSSSLGGNFEQNLRSIRDLRFEFGRFKLLLEYVSMRFVSSIFKAFGTDVQGAQAKLREFTTWLEERLPAAGDAIAENFVPVLKTAWTVLKEIGEAPGEVGVLFTNVIGALVGFFTGDFSLQGTTLDFEKLAKAIGVVVHVIGQMMHVLVTAEKMLAHFVNAAVLALSGNFTQAKEELASAMKELGPNSGAIAGAVVGGALGSVIPGAGTAAGAAWGMGIGAALGGVNKEVNPEDDHVALKVAAPELPKQQSLFETSNVVHNNDHSSVVHNNNGYTTNYLPGEAGKPGEPGAPGLPGQPGMAGAPAMLPQNLKVDSGPIADLVARTAQQKGVDPRLAQAVAHQESGTRQFKKDGSLVSSGKAVGVMQLTNDTAKDQHVDPRDTRQNVEGGVTYLAQLMKRYHDNVPKALAAYNMGPNGLDRAIKQHRALPMETQNYVQSIMRNMTGQQISMGDVNIAITQPGANAQEIAQATKQGIREALGRQNVRNSAQLAYVG